MNGRTLFLKLIAYFLIFTCIVYSVSFTVAHLFPEPNLLQRILAVLLLFSVLYFVFRVKLPSLKPEFTFQKSIIHVFSILSVGYAFPVIIIVLMGADQVYINAKPVFINLWTPNILLFGVVYWLINGVIVAYFYHALTYNLFSKNGKLFGIFVSAVLFTLNYNVPLISGYWNPWDILFYGLGFSYSYSENRDIFAILLAYLVSEEPLWWCLLAPFGSKIFALFLEIRFIFSVCALILYIRRYHKGGMDCGQ